ncbi:hypothetical protein HPP92_008718 [Vanilla planifolia]|uniref:Uncharacterized protein n=1 Tax=Vanilla planifolia TaxID=51239 RepID=A0A835V6N8_VANPL|nr:hypothetical protein HPP92_008718 [Vanilla planifolia]
MVFVGGMAASYGGRRFVCLPLHVIAKCRITLFAGVGGPRVIGVHGSRCEVEKMTSCTKSKADQRVTFHPMHCCTSFSWCICGSFVMTDDVLRNKGKKKSSSNVA